MAGAGIYRVGTGYYSSIQAAIDALKSDQGLTAFAATQTILLMDDGSYAGFEISELNPTSSYPLVIQPDNLISATIETVSAADWTGITISSVDYVHIKDLAVSGFTRGIVASGCAGLKLLRCRITRNQLVGVYLADCDSPKVIRCAMLESETLLSLSGCLTPRVIHNSFCNLSIGKYAIQWIPPYEWGGVRKYAEENQLVFINNVLSCARTPCMVLPEGHGPSFANASNNVYFSGVNGIALVQQNISGVITEYKIDGIDAWRRFTGGEDASRFTYPGFLLTSDGLPSNYLTLGRFSTIGLTGLQLVSAVPSPLPVDVLEADVALDIGGDAARTPPTPGSHELDPSNDFDYASFFGTYADVDSLGNNGVGRVAEYLEQAANKADLLLRSGHFFIRDSKFYLFAEKASSYLGDIAWAQVDLPVDLVDVSVYFGDNLVEFQQIGRRVYISCAGIDTNYGQGSFEVVGTRRDWISEEHAFSESSLSFIYLMSELPLRFFLPSDPVDGAPIVVTDDLCSLRDDTSVVPHAFSSVWNEDVESVELVFEGNRNLLRNADFAYELDRWQSLNAEVDTSYVTPSDVLPLCGDNVLRLSSELVDTSYVAQEFERYDPSEDCVISFHMASVSTGSLTVIVRKMNEDRQLLSTSSVSIDCRESAGENAWERFYLFGKASADSSMGVEPLGATPLGAFDLFRPDGVQASFVELKLMAGASSLVYLDAVQVVGSSALPKFSRLPGLRDCTVEYEASSDGVCATGLSFSPVLNPQHAGFVTISPVPATDWDPTAPSGSNSLWDWRWPAGRLGPLPWARLSGPNKYVYLPTPNFPTDSMGVDREVSGPSLVKSIAKMTVEPAPLIVGRSSQGQALVHVFDSFDNPVAWRKIRVDLRSPGGFAGYLGVREMGAPASLDTSVEIATDGAGVASMAVISPGSEFLSVGVPSPTLGTPMVDLPYPANADGHGNFRVINPETWADLDLIGDEYEESVALASDGEWDSASLTKYPVPGTISVFVDDTSVADLRLTATENPIPSEGEFFVDELQKQLKLPAGSSAQALVRYQPRRVWLTPGDLSTLHFATDLIPELPDYILLEYDAAVSLIAGEIGGDDFVTSEVIYRRE